MMAVFRWLRATLETFHAFIIALGAVALILLAVDVIPDLLKAAGQALKPQPRDSADIRSPDFRTGSEAYRGEDWAPYYFYELQQSHYNVSWESYVYWRARPNAGRYITIDADGSRRTPQPPRPEGSSGAPFRIHMFGASTLFGLGSRDAHTIPAHLGREIGEKTRCAVEVRNFGQVGYVTTQDTIALLRQLHRGDVPDLAVFYGGANEVYSAIGSGEAGSPQNEDNRRREFNILHPQQRNRLIAEAAPLMFRRTAQHARNAAEVFGLLPPEAAKPKIAWRRDYGEFADAILDFYRGDIEFAAAMARQFGFRTLFAWQPLIYSKKILTPYETHIKEVDGVQIDNGIHLFEAAYARVANHVGIAGRAEFVDLSHVLKDSPEPLFLDISHTTERANALIAAALFPAVRALLPEDCRERP